MGCGVLGIVLHEDDEQLLPLAKTGLGRLNHRGEDAHGISFLNPEDNQIKTRKSMGLVRGSDIFDDQDFGSFLIGHTRYRTSSTGSLENAQPIEFSLPGGRKAAISHNGNLTNDRELLRSELKVKQEGMSDTRVLGMLLAKSLRRNDEFDHVKETLSKVAGSYSITLLVGGADPKVIAIRDPYGYMPLRYGSNENGFFVASESVAFDRKYLNVAKSRDVKPGEMLVINQSEVVTYQLFESKQKQHCMFQPVYMCRPESKLGEDSVYVIRERLGIEIAKDYRPKVDFVVPVPESGVPASYGYSRATGVPVRMGIVRDRYESGRSFMQDDQYKREDVVNKKLNIIPDILRDQRVLLLEDSLVRGTTMRKLIEEIRVFAGATEVHIALSCPPIVSECRYGIDFYNKDLVARPFHGREHEEINAEVAEKIGADSVHYQTIDGLAEALGTTREKLCLSCLTGIYVQPGSFVSEEERKK